MRINTITYFTYEANPKVLKEGVKFTLSSLDTNNLIKGLRKKAIKTQTRALSPRVSVNTSIVSPKPNAKSKLNQRGVFTGSEIIANMYR